MTPGKARKQTIAGAMLDVFDQVAAEKSTQANGPMSFIDFMRDERFGRPYLEVTADGGPIMTSSLEAIIAASDGHPEGIDPSLSLKLFKCRPNQLPRAALPLVIISAGRGSGKTTRLLAGACIHKAWTVHCPHLSPNEKAKCLLIAPRRKHAKKALQCVLGIINMSPVLRKAVRHKTTESITLQRPDGKEVTIEVASSNIAGLDLRGVTLLFVGVDEAAFLHTADSYTVTDKQIVEAILPRLVEGAQLWLVSTPWIKGKGEMERYVESDWGNPKNAFVVAEVPSRALNPHLDPNGRSEAALRARPGGDLSADREYLAIPFPENSRAWFSAADVAFALNEKSPSTHVLASGAGSDLGFSRDASAIAISRRHQAGVFSVIECKEIRPEAEKALVPSYVCSHFATISRMHGIVAVAADKHYAETFREHLGQAGMALIDAPAGNEGKVQVYMAARELFAQRRITLGDLPQGMKEELREQLLSITSRPMEGGRISIDPPRRRISDDGLSGGHCDAVSAILLSLWAAGAGTGVAPDPADETFTIDSMPGFIDPDDESYASPPGLEGTGGFLGAGAGW